MKNLKYIINYCYILLSVLSCQGNLFPEEKNIIVVEGWIENDGFPIVILTTNVQLSGDYENTEDLETHLIRWAKVTISDGIEEVILTGMVNDKYFPPYIYTTGQMRGKAGHTYNLKVEYDKYLATATTTIPDIVNIDSVKVAHCADNDTLYQLTAHFTDHPNTHDYYLFFVNNSLEYSQPMLSYMGYIDDTLSSTQHISTPIYREQSIFNSDDYIPYFHKSDTVVIKMAHVNAETFAFWNDVQSSVSFSTSMYMPVNTNVRSNISGGIGFWQGYGVSSKVVIIDQ